MVCCVLNGYFLPGMMAACGGIHIGIHPPSFFFRQTKMADIHPGQRQFVGKILEAFSAAFNRVLAGFMPENCE